MNVKNILEQKIIHAVKELYDIEIDDVHIEHPEEESHGDFATNVSFVLAKKIDKNPTEIGKELADQIQSYDLAFSYDEKEYPLFTNIEVAAPGFVNFYVSLNYYKKIIRQVIEEKDNYGVHRFEKEKNLMVEYSQPNPNKPMHVGHARNNFLGSSLANILGFYGYNVIKANYMNNWSRSICMPMLMYKKYFAGEEPDKKSDHFVGDLYARYTKEAEQNPELKEELAQMFRDLEAGDPETVKLWEKILNFAYKGWKNTYEQEKVDFDVWFYQDEYKDSGKDIVNQALQKDIAYKDESGAVVAKLEEYNLPNKVLLRSDGTSIYVTQDLQLAKDTFEKYNLDKRLYIVDCRQSGYFKQLFKLVELLGFDFADKLYHVGYGFVDLPEGAMSSRYNMVVTADEVYETLVGLEEQEIKESIKSVSNLEQTAKKLALAAFRYGLLKVDPKQNVTFEFDKVTKFEGNTGPYLMYTYARAGSIMEKAGLIKESYVPSAFFNAEADPLEETLARNLSMFSEIVEKCAQEMTPHYLANYLFDVCQKFNSFYAKIPVIKSENEVQLDFRLSLCMAVSVILKNGLKLLGIDVVEKM